MRKRSLALLSGLRIWRCRKLRRKPAAAALIRSLAWEPPYAAGAALHTHTHTHTHTLAHTHTCTHTKCLCSPAQHEAWIIPRGIQLLCGHPSPQSWQRRESHWPLLGKGNLGGGTPQTQLNGGRRTPFGGVSKSGVKRHLFYPQACLKAAKCSQLSATLCRVATTSMGAGPILLCSHPEDVEPEHSHCTVVLEWCTL